MTFATTIKDKISSLSPKSGGAALSPSVAQYFRKGMFCGFSIFFLVFIWMFLRGPDTAVKVQPLLPAKTIAIITPEKQAPVSEEKTQADPSEHHPENENLVGGHAVAPLPKAPIDGLYETLDGKILPLVNITGDETPFNAYKRLHAPIAGRPQVSIVVVDFGLSGRLAESMLKTLPAEITFVLNPYAADASKWAAAARGYGHEFWLELPMQKNDAIHNDAGPDAIGSKLSIEENTARTIGILATAPGYAGVVTSQNHGLNDADLSAASALKQVYGRGLAMAESNPERAAWGLTMAMENAYPYVQNNYWIDTDLKPDAIQAALREMEGLATRKGKVIVFLHPYPLVMQKIQKWAENSESNGFQLAPLSSMVSQ